MSTVHLEKKLQVSDVQDGHGKKVQILYIRDRLTHSRKRPQNTLIQPSTRFWLGKVRPSKEIDLLTQGK